MHHIEPLAVGGANEATNLVPLCEQCHDRAHKVTATWRCAHGIAHYEGPTSADALLTSIGVPFTA
jgi:5-methylcytosine-specific restriction endonuclease McrA